MSVAPGSLHGPIEVEGVGVHTGELCRVVIDLGEQRAGSLEGGLVFVRGGVRIPALAGNVVDAQRCTRLEVDGVSVSTIEHLMSALAGVGVSSATIQVDGPELPILDGSALGWLEALRPFRAPWEQETGSLLRTTPISEAVRIEGKSGSFIEVRPAQRLSITLTIAYDHPVIGTQTACFTEGDDYEKEIAPARTFGLRSEVDALRAAGLARGGSLDNAIVVEDDGYSTPLRFENELARHKILDLLGDLYLSGSLPEADIIAMKPSHMLNVALASKLTEVFEKNWKSMPEGC